MSFIRLKSSKSFYIYYTLDSIRNNTLAYSNDSIFFDSKYTQITYFTIIFISILILFTGSYDSSVFVWDIGGRKGTVYELNGHRGKVNTVTYVPSAKSLLSTSEDSNLVIWNMTVHRTEVQ